MEGNLRFKIDWASLVVGRKFTIFALFHFALEGKFQVQAPWGAYIRRGLYMEGLIFGILRYIKSFTQYITVRTGYLSSIRPLIICCDTLFMFIFRFINFVLQSKLSYATTSEFSLLKWSSLELVAYETFKNSLTTHKRKTKEAYVCYQCLYGGAPRRSPIAKEMW